MKIKWTKELDEELKKLIYIGKHHDEIAVELNATKKSISNRCFRLQLKTITHKQYECKQCLKVFIDILSNKRKFCSNSCSNTFSSTGRIHSEESKQKARQKLVGRKQTQERIEKTSGKNSGMYIDGRSHLKYLKRLDIVDGKKKCRNCNEYKIEKRYKIICDDCRYSYYELYRPSCEFNFKITDYPIEFDFNLVKKYGWYSPSNKGNNLNGVSRDHLYSVKDGFVNNVDCEIIKHPANCCLLKHTKNSSKHCKSAITFEELLIRIENWNEKYNKLTVLWPSG